MTQNPTRQSNQPSVTCPGSNVPFYGISRCSGYTVAVLPAVHDFPLENVQAVTCTLVFELG